MREPLSQTAPRILAGALLAAALGSSAGAALKPKPVEQGAPAAPQLICLSDFELASLEAATQGRPAFTPS